MDQEEKLLEILRRRDEEEIRTNDAIEVLEIMVCDKAVPALFALLADTKLSFSLRRRAALAIYSLGMEDATVYRMVRLALTGGREERTLAAYAMNGPSGRPGKMTQG